MKKYLQVSVALMESLAIPAIMLALGFYLNPSDPFFMHVAFPWVWLASILIGLRYGIRYGLISLAIIIAAIFYTVHILHLEVPGYPIFIFGGVVLTLICSEYKEAWAKQQHYLQKQTSYLKEQVENLSKDHTILRFSHARLEHSSITKPTTLRDALINLNKFLQESHGVLTKETGDRFLQLLAYYTSFEVGALFLNHHNAIDITPLAQLGINKPLVLDDPLVQRALESKQTSYFAVNSLGKKVQSDYLVVAPLLCNNSSLLGLLVIAEMPFLMLHNENLKFLSILLAYFSDEIWATQQATIIQKQYPDCPASFAAEIFKVEHLWRDIKVDSAIVAFYLYPHPERDTLLSEILSLHRASDRAWQTQTDQCEILIVLMPLTTSVMTKGLLERANRLLEQFPYTLAEGLIKIRSWQISAYPDVNQLLDQVVKNETSH